MRKTVERLGPVRHMVAPDTLHHLFLTDWCAADPEARAHAVPGLTRKAAGAAIHARLGDAPDPARDGRRDQVVLRGNRITTEAVFYHRASATVLVTDLVRQFPAGWSRAQHARGQGRSDDRAGTVHAPLFRLATTGRSVARAAVGGILIWPAVSMS